MMILETIALGAIIGAVSGVFTIRDEDKSIVEKALIGAGMGATAGLAGGVISGLFEGGGSDTVKNLTSESNIVRSLPSGSELSFTGSYAGRTAKQWEEAAKEHAIYQVEHGINQGGYIRDCLRNAEKAKG